MSQDIRCVADIARHHARVRPAETAIWFEGAVTTYGELDRLASQCAQALIAAGVTPGERVGVLTKGSDAFFLLWLGCLKAGACLTPVNWRLAPPEIAFVLKDAGCRLVVTGADFAPVIEKIAADIEKLGGGVVGVIGHADRRGSDAYNVALGMRRAKAVYEAIAARLGAEARSRLRVEINDDPTAPVGLRDGREVR